MLSTKQCREILVKLSVKLRMKLSMKSSVGVEREVKREVGFVEYVTWWCEWGAVWMRAAPT